MELHTQKMIEEHAQLVKRIDSLNDFLYSGINIHTDINNNKTQDSLLKNMIEFANKAIQLRSMKTYLLALECRLNNEGIYFENGEYLERVAVIKETPVSTEPENDGDGR